MDHLFGIYKDEGITSAKILGEVRKRLQLERNIKIGHGGTLDQAAKGILVVGIGKGTKRLPDFLSGTKEYYAKGCFGQKTDTGDKNGQIIENEKYDHITEEMIDEVLEKQFTGKIMQKPPEYSALKKNGKRYSDLVRQGHSVEIKPREIVIEEIILMGCDLPDFELQVRCHGGTYIRSLIRDLGEALGSVAYMTDLERTQQGDFDLETSYHLYQLKPELLK